MNALLNRLRLKLTQDAWLDDMMNFEAAFAESVEPCPDDFMDPDFEEEYDRESHASARHALFREGDAD